MNYEGEWNFIIKYSVTEKMAISFYCSDLCMIVRCRRLIYEDGLVVATDVLEALTWEAYSYLLKPSEFCTTSSGASGTRCPFSFRRALLQSEFTVLAGITHFPAWRKCMRARRHPRSCTLGRQACLCRWKTTEACPPLLPQVVSALRNKSTLLWRNRGQSMKWNSFICDMQDR